MVNFSDFYCTILSWKAKIDVLSYVVMNLKNIYLSQNRTSESQSAKITVQQKMLTVLFQFVKNKQTSGKKEAVLWLDEIVVVDGRNFPTH